MSDNDMLDRRSALKGIGSAVAAASFGTSVATADGASSDTEPRDFSDHRTLEFGRDLKQLGKNWMFVAGPSEQVYNYIEKGDAGPSKQRALKSAYKDIERQYPTVRRSVDDNTTQIALADDAAGPDALGRETRSQLDEVATAVSQGSAKADGSDVEANWYRKIHVQTAELAANSEARYPWAADRMYKNLGEDTPGAYYPDKRDTTLPEDVKSVIENKPLGNKIIKYLKNVVQSFLHYRNPDNPPLDLFPDDSVPDEYALNEGGLAHYMAQQETDKAINYYEGGNKTWGYKHLGYASHYIADISNPLHTGMEIEQASDYIATVVVGGKNKNKAVHYRHEGHVNSKWGDWYKNRVKDEPGHFYGFDSVQSETNDLASETQNDASTVFYDVMFKDADDWKSSLRNLNEDRLAQTVSYTKGLFDVME